MLAQTVFLLALAASSNAAAPGIRASVSSTALNYLAVSCAVARAAVELGLHGQCWNLTPSAHLQTCCAQDVFIPVIEKKFATITIPDVSSLPSNLHLFHCFTLMLGASQTF